MRATDPELIEIDEEALAADVEYDRRTEEAYARWLEDRTIYPDDPNEGWYERSHPDGWR